MAFASCSGLLLIIILLALEYSTADGYQGNIVGKGETGKTMSLLDASDGTIASASASARKILGGRKFLQELDGKTMSTSAKNKPADLQKSFQEPVTEQDHVDFQSQDKVETWKQEKNHKSEGTRVPSDDVFPKHDYGTVAVKNDEHKAFLDAAEEVANLIRKDYKGDRPRRKPPINNHQPTD